MPTSDFDVTVKLLIPESRVADLICAGMEGGIGYWGRIVEYIEPKEIWKGNGWSDAIFPHIHYPMSDGGALVICDAEFDPDDENTERWRFDRKAISRGLRRMATDPRYMHHFANFMDENEDAITGDVFIQLCCMGEVVFG